MTESILVVDPGMTWTTAAIVSNGGSQVLKEPSSGSFCWPTAVALDGKALCAGTLAQRRRRSSPLLFAGNLTGRLGSGQAVALGGRRYLPHELFAALLSALKAEAERLAGPTVDRILLLAPDALGTQTAVGQALAGAANTAGFTDVELLFLPAAVAATGRHPPGTLVLVCDAGASAARLTLLQAQYGLPAVLCAQAAVAACGGGHLDALVADAVQDRNKKWLGPLLAAADPVGSRTQLDLADLARRLRHELTDSVAAEDTLTAVTPLVRFTRPDLDKQMRSALGQLTAACRDVAKEGAAKVRGSAVADVLLVGGCARTPALQQALTSALARPVSPVPAPELAALRGGIEWASAAVGRQVIAVPTPVALLGLAWPIPSGAARLNSWSVFPGQEYAAGAPLARIRDDDGAVWDLVSDRPGFLAQGCAGPGAIVATGEIVAITRFTSIVPADRRDTPLRLAALHGGMLARFSPDSRQLATLDARGTLRIWDTDSAAELARYPVVAGPGSGSIDVARQPNGYWLAAFSGSGGVHVRDLGAARPPIQVAKGADFKTVQFSADGRRICTAAPQANRLRVADADGKELLTVKERLLSPDIVALSYNGAKIGLVSRAGIEVREHGGMRSLVRPLRNFKGRIWFLAFTPDGSALLASVEGQLDLIDIASGKSLWCLEFPNPVRRAGFSPDARLLATVGQSPGDSMTVLRDAASGREVTRIVSAYGPASCVAFSPDGRFMVTSEGDNAVLWALVR
jgi:hypothetical protein